MSVLIISGSKSDEKHVKAIQAALEGSSIESRWVYASAHKETQKVDAALRISNGLLSPLITVAGRSDALSGHCACRSLNPVVASRPDWYDETSLSMYYFSTVGMPSRVPVGAVLGPGETANYVRRLLRLQVGASCDASELALVGDKIDAGTVGCFQQALSKLSLGVTARRYTIDEVNDPSIPACVLFAYLDDNRQIDGLLEKTQWPVILCPPRDDKGALKDATFRAIHNGYRPVAAMVYDAPLAAEYGAEILGLANPCVRQAVRDSKPRF